MSEQENLLQLAKQIPFTQVSNEALDETALSWKAKGLYSYLLSKATLAGWRFKKSHLVKQSKDGRESLEGAIKELKETGFLELIPQRTKGGTFNGWRWIVHLSSQLTPKNRNTEKPKYGKPVLRENRITENPYLNNNTEDNNTKKNNTKSSKKDFGQSEKRKRTDSNDIDLSDITVQEFSNSLTADKDTKDFQLVETEPLVDTKADSGAGIDYKREARIFYDSNVRRGEVVDEANPLFSSWRGFQKFWDEYPDQRKKTKLEAWVAWHNATRIRSEAELEDRRPFVVEIIAHVIKSKKEDADWLRGYAPMPTTYLNQRRWEAPLAKAATRLGQPSDFTDTDKIRRSEELMKKIRERSNPNFEQE